MSNVFKEYSQYYNLLYKDKDYKTEVDYIDGVIRDYTPGAKSVLDLGCGTGRHDFYLTQKGYDVFGVDMSDTMLRFAKNVGINCVQGDVRTFRGNRKFDAVVSLFHVASYQVTDPDIISFFKTISYHMDKNGVCVFDVWYKPAVLFQKPEDRVKELEDENVHIKRFCHSNHVPQKSLVEVNYKIDITNKKDGTKSALKEKHFMRYYSKDELEKFASSCGIQIVRAEEFVTKNKPSINTWGVCFVGIKEK
ncbi:MAG: class I SAM-dependent methyltransferase [Alphaproteobacteria bacterium]|nr:class I SAM-dependent methyltransferase [Alphaproteobacteria bacterium]